MKTIISMRREMMYSFFFLFCIFIGNRTTIFAQDYSEICGMEDIAVNDSYLYFDNDPNYLNTLEPLVLNVYFWGIKPPYGGTDPNDLTEQKALEAIQTLNIGFNPYQIYFKYKGFSSFNSPVDVEWVKKNTAEDCEDCADYPFETDPTSPNYCTDNPNIYNIDPDGFGILDKCQINAFKNYYYTTAYYDPNVINIYVPRSLQNIGGYGNPFIVSSYNLNRNTLIHEMGHRLGLSIHTHKGWYSPDNVWNCEHVTRDNTIPCDPVNGNSNVPCYNANDRGDKITDTAAMPDFRYEYCKLNGLPSSDCVGNGPHPFAYYDTDECEYTGNQGNNNRTDCQGTPYQINPTQSQNYMSYAPSSCMSNFTNEQVFKMRNYINTNLQIKQDSIAALYEPYKGEYYYSGPYIPSQHTPYFQPGFNYRFVECDCACPQPIEYGNLNFTYNSGNAIKTVSKYENDFSKIWHPNHTAIEIDFGILPNPLQTIQRCYDNTNKASSGGSITLFNDGVFNANVTITPQDSTQINNPNLINQLAPGLYNITKQYIDEGNQETVILKENN